VQSPLNVFYFSLWLRGHCTAHCPELLRNRPMGYQAVMLLAAPPHLLRQLLCPSQHFIHSLLTSLHSTSFAAKHFASVFGCTLPFTLSFAKCAGTNTFAKLPSACHSELSDVLTGFHSALFVATSFKYCSVHTLPIIWLAGIPTFGCAQLANTNCSARTSHSQSIAKLRLHSSAASVSIKSYFGGFLWSWHRLLPMHIGISLP
jgi:hypothetical protein